MAGVGLEFIANGTTEVAAMFDDARGRAKNLDTPLEQSSKTMLKAFDMNFDNRGNTLGAPWKPRLEPYGWPLLQKTGLMRHGFAAAFGTDFVTLFNKQWYFRYHQSAAPRKTRLPRRVMMKIDETRRVQIVKYFQAWIMGQ